MAEIINFSSYNAAETILQQQAAAVNYSNIHTALDAHPGWSVIEGSKVTNGATVGGAAGASKVVPISNYIQTAAELEGGVVGATEAVEIAETGVVAGEVAAGTSGLFAGWTVGTAVAGILAGVGVGIVGYDLAPEFWTGLSNKIFPGQDINYEDIKDYSLIGLIKEEVFGIEPQVTTYLSSQLVADVLNYCAELGVFDPTIQYCTNDDLDTELFNYPEYINGEYAYYVNDTPIFMFGQSQRVIRAIEFTEPVYIFIGSNNSSGENYYFAYAMSKSPFTIDGLTQPMNFINSMDEQIYCYGSSWYQAGSILSGINFSVVPQIISFNNNFWHNDISILLYHGINATKGGYKGTYELPDSPQIYDPTKPLPQQYPNWIGDREIETHGLEYPADDPTLYPIPWIPVKMPEYDPQQNPEKYPLYIPGLEPEPTPGPGAQPEPRPYPEKEPQPDAQKGKYPDKYPPTAPDPTNWPRKDPDTGDKKPVDPQPPVDPTPTPPIIFPTIGGEANALFTVYKPVISELNSLAGVLWSSNFLDNLIKIFTNNPMDAVISLHMLYATPHIGGIQNIKLGYLDTGIASDVVDKQYLQIDCGTVRIPEYFGDARDYVNSVVDVYLPFVGMRHLKTQDIVGSYVTIKAGVDVFTGTILYTINIRKTSGINQVMYAFEGNCAVALPLTGADKSRMFSVLGAAATGAAIGGATGAVVGAFGSAMNGSQQADVQRTGNFGANSGAMGVKKPYIVVSRNVGYDANRYNYYHGYPANKTVTLGSCVGYTKVLDVRVEGIPNATDAELTEIETVLKSGVIF